MPCALELIAILQSLNQSSVKASVILYRKQVVSEGEVSQHRTCHCGFIYSLSIARLRIHIGHRSVSCFEGRMPSATRFCNFCIKPFFSEGVRDKVEQNIRKELRLILWLIQQLISRNDKLVPQIIGRNRLTNLTKLVSKGGIRPRFDRFGLQAPQFWRDLIRPQFPEAEGCFWRRLSSRGPG